MRRNFSKLVCVLLSIVMCCACFASSVMAITFEQPDGTLSFDKITHPENGAGENDGIVDYVGGGVVSAEDLGQGARGQSYSWCAAGRGEYVYVGTCYGAMTNTLTLMDDVLGGNFDDEQLDAILNVLYNGSFFVGEEDGANAGGVLTKINTTTGEVSIIMSKSTTGHNALFRNVTPYNGKYYFCGSVNGLPSIYEIDPETDEFTMVYQGMTLQEYYQGYLQGICTGIRGLCEFDGELILSCVTLDGPIILSSSNPSEGFEVIATQEDLFNYPAYHYCDSIYGGSIWEIVEFNGSMYVSICTGTPDNMPDELTMQSFALVRGDKDESGNWTWTSVIGDQENDGAKYTFGIDPERTRSGAGVLQVYGDYLYIGEYNDEEIALMNVLTDVNFDFMNANLSQSVSLYRMDKDENIELVVGDATEMFPDGSLSGIGSGFGRYEGKLYVGTFDTSSLLEPLGQFVNGDILHMSREEWLQLISFIRSLISISIGNDDDDTNAARNDFVSKYDDETIAYMLMTGDVSKLGLDMRSAGIDCESVKAYLLENDVSALPGGISDLIGYFDGLNGFMNTVRSLITCATYLRSATRGFDMYVSDDGINFETVTIDGFGDPYNHGLRVFAGTDNGLTIGTANPFYGTQVWLMNEPESEIVQHNVEFVDGITGEIIGSIVVNDGDVVSEELFPVPAEHDGYTFVEWDYDNSPVTDDIIITSVYDEVEEPLLGDVNDDGEVNTYDVIIIVRYILGVGEIEFPERADINDDGVVDMFDAILLLRMIM